MKYNCDYCGKSNETDEMYEVAKLKGKDAGHWRFCSDVCLHDWLRRYNPLLTVLAEANPQE